MRRRKRKTARRPTRALATVHSPRASASRVSARRPARKAGSARRVVDNVVRVVDSATRFLAEFNRARRGGRGGSGNGGGSW